MNKKITACIFERGGVGASGDLVQIGASCIEPDW